MHLSDINLRDPFVFPHEQDWYYYLVGSAALGSKPARFDGYRSRDLEEWEGPFPLFKPAPDFWSDMDFWSPELHRYRGKFYIWASFKSDGCCRGTQILVSDQVCGPYEPLSPRPVTPADWECLDGTLFVDEQQEPWMVFCHEWIQVQDGAIYAMRLSPDLARAIEEPVLLFKATEAPWVHGIPYPHDNKKSGYVTDGPFLYRLPGGALIMLWSSFGEKGYAMGIARSESGKITGPWHQAAEPLWAEDGGHGMIFTTFDGRNMLTFHSPNNQPDERPIFVEIDVQDDAIQIKA